MVPASFLRKIREIRPHEERKHISKSEKIPVIVSVQDSIMMEVDEFV